MGKMILPILVLFFCIQVKAEESTKHPVDIQLEKCLDSSENYMTSGMMNCYAEARDAWDKELNKYYKLLMDILSADEKEKLRKSQRSWLTYRDNELDFSGTTYYNLDGTMWRVTAAQRSCEIVKQRALELKDYYQDLSGF